MLVFGCLTERQKSRHQLRFVQLDDASSSLFFNFRQETCLDLESKVEKTTN